MSMQKFFIFLSVFVYVSFGRLNGQQVSKNILDAEDAVVGASRLERYLDKLEGKNVGIIANQTSVFNNKHLVDTLLTEGVNVIKIFTPEHGFRGTADEGASVNKSTSNRGVK